MLLLDLVALERVHLVGITVGLTLTSPVTDLKKKTISKYSCQFTRTRGEGPV